MAPRLLAPAGMRAPDTTGRLARATGRTGGGDPVLVVDDDPVCSQLMATALQCDGYRVEWTSDPVRAVELVRERRYAALVSDVNMPGVSGIALALEATRVSPDVRILLVTGVADPRVRAQAAAIGSVLLAKPIRVEALCAAVHGLLEPHAAAGSVR